MLNSIPVDHQPSERKQFTWLFGRVKRCKMIQRHIDKIRDSSPTSNRSSFKWLLGKIKSALSELREDQNEDSVRNALSPSKRQKEKDKSKGANAATVDEEKEAGSSKAMPSPKAKPKAKQPGKGDGKGKGNKGDKPKGPPPASKAQPTPKAAGPAEAKGKPTVPCLFFPKGTCNRGAESPFAYVDTPAAKEKPKASKAAPATAKATVATLPLLSRAVQARPQVLLFQMHQCLQQLSSMHLPLSVSCFPSLQLSAQQFYQNLDQALALTRVHP